MDKLELIGQIYINETPDTTLLNTSLVSFDTRFEQPDASYDVFQNV